MLPQLQNKPSRHLAPSPAPAAHPKNELGGSVSQVPETTREHLLNNPLPPRQGTQLVQALGLELTEGRTLQREGDLTCCEEKPKKRHWALLNGRGRLVNGAGLGPRGLPGALELRHRQSSQGRA